jgi:hypothetical protein
MSTLDKARQSQLENIQKKTGISLMGLREVISQSGLTKHSEVRQMLMEHYGLGFGDANMLVHYAMQSDGQSAAEAANLSTEAVLQEIYSGSRAILRPLYDTVMALIQPMGSFEIVPKKGYVSLRRKRQFAMLGPGTKGRLELGLNMKGVSAEGRLEALPPGGMCQYRVFLTDISEVDENLAGWIRIAFESSGN